MSLKNIKIKTTMSMIQRWVRDGERQFSNGFSEAKQTVRVAGWVTATTLCALDQQENQTFPMALQQSRTKTYPHLSGLRPTDSGQSFPDGSERASRVSAGWGVARLLLWP